MPLADPAPRVICNRGPTGNPPGWTFRPQPSELAYLGWGRRRYGDMPIPQVTHEGWHYFFVLAGTPILLMGEAQLRGFPGFATICDPGCPVGHTGTRGSVCEILVSIWRTPPRHSGLRPPPRGTLTFTLEPSLLLRIKRLGARCREAAVAATERNELELQCARLQLELALLEVQERAAAPALSGRIDLALQFLRQHLTSPRPLSLLCDYLQVSPSSLKRLFVEQTGKNPRTWMNALRMEWAHERLAEGDASVKEISHRLGYRHATDFTRAFKQHYAQTPRTVLRRVG